MWIVRLALRRPYTFVVLALLIAVLGILSVETMLVDIFPSINIPGVTVICSFSVLLASLSSDQLSEQQLQDLGNNFIRTQLVTIPGAAIPAPYGGKVRGVNVDIDPDALYSRGLSPQDVSNAILTQNVILPAGTVKIGTYEYDVATNSSPVNVDDLNKVPVRYVNGATVHVGDVAFVHDGFNPQTNLVRRDGRHSVLLPILSNGSDSTLSVVDQARQLMPKILAGLPPSLKVDFLFDQSVFVRATITGVVREGAIAGCLTALMILLFLGSWRSTLIVITSIPLSILTSIIMLKILNQSLNAMTLGGLALAVGIREGAVDWAWAGGRVVVAVFLPFAFPSLSLYPYTGRDFFPTVDAGQLRLPVRAPAGTRIGQTEVYFQQVEDYLRQVIPANEIGVI